MTNLVGFCWLKLLFVNFPFGTEMRMSQQNHEGGWSEIGMATVGIHPNDFDLYPNKIPLGRVVQNCPWWSTDTISTFLNSQVSQLLLKS